MAPMPCPNCRKYIESGGSFCPHCRAPLAGPVPPPPPYGSPSHETAVGPYIAWEDMTRGVFPRFWKTWADSQFKFDDCFRRMPLQGGIGAPLKYVLFMTLQMIALLAVCGVPLLLLLFLAGTQGPGGPGGPGAGMGIGIIAVIAVFYLVLYVAAMVAGTFISAGIYHLSAMIFGGRGTYEATYRATCYAWGANIWNLIPYIGGLIYLVFHVLAMTHGLAYAHGISKGKAVAAVLVPLVLCCGLLIAIYAVILFAVFAGPRGGPWGALPSFIVYIS